MNLVLRLTLAMMVSMCAVFAVDGYVRVRSQAEMFDTDNRRDQHTLARAVAIATASIWATQGREAALGFVAHANQRHAKTQIRWVSLAPAAKPKHRPALEPSLLAPLLDEQEITQIERDAAGEGRLFTYVPISVDGVAAGAIELEESLAEERAFLRSRIVRAFVVGTIMLLASGILAMVLGVQFVGRPIRRLIAKARRIAAGDFSDPLRLRQRDELSELANEMNLMADSLAAAQRRIEEQARGRIAALEQLRHAERLSTVGQLASGIAHELGTPLNVVAGRAEMVASGEASGAEVVTNARIIGEQAERMTKIIRDLLNLARRRTPVRTRVDVVNLVRDTLELLKPLALKTEVQLGLAANGFEGDGQVEVDVEQLRQVVTNLVMNAVQASPPGSCVDIRLGRAVSDTRSDATVQNQPHLRIDVEDHGGGIAENARPHIFEPFFTTKPVGEGTGLGLSVAHGIVQDHGGWIDVDTREGQGTCFSVFLPLGTAA
jgi:signal transduction histidine kinase